MPQSFEWRQIATVAWSLSSTRLPQRTLPRRSTKSFAMGLIQLGVVQVKGSPPRNTHSVKGVDLRTSSDKDRNNPDIILAHH